MTKKDYELIAGAIKANYDHAKQNKGANPTPDFVVSLCAETLAGTLEVANPKFDRKKFLTACGIEN